MCEGRVGQMSMFVVCGIFQLTSNFFFFFLVLNKFVISGHQK